jgi:hypothetical protein
VHEREKKKVLRKSGPKRKEGMGGWRRLHNEKPYNFSTSPNIIRVIKSRWMRWAGQVVQMG